LIVLWFDRSASELGGRQTVLIALERIKQLVSLFLRQLAGFVRRALSRLRRLVLGLPAIGVSFLAFRFGRLRLTGLG